MQALLNQLDNLLTRVFGNVYVSTFITLFLVLYAGLAAPELPPFIAGLFENPFFRFLILFLVLVVRNYNPTVAVLSVVAFVLSMQALNRHRMFAMANEIAANGCVLPGEEGEGEEGEAQMGYAGEEDEEGEEGEAPCVKPLPQEVDLVLPPQSAQPEQVAAVLSGCGYQGPQGMQHPYGFPGVVYGAPYATPDSEL